MSEEKEEFLDPYYIQKLFRVPRSTVNDLLRKGQIGGAVQLQNKRWKINKREFETWIENNMSKEEDLKPTRTAYKRFLKFDREFWDWFEHEWLIPSDLRHVFDLEKSTFYENLSNRIPGVLKLGRSLRIHLPTLRKWHCKFHASREKKAEEKKARPKKKFPIEDEKVLFAVPPEEA